MMVYPLAEMSRTAVAEADNDFQILSKYTFRMDDLLRKMNYAGQSEVCVVNSPTSFDARLASWRLEAEVHESLGPNATFVVAFATTKDAVDAIAQQAHACTQGDATVWVAYPKTSSKRYRCDFNRDTGWDQFGAHGFEPVRQVAIDEDWSALRFRRVEYIKKMTRSFAMTEEGRAKSQSPD